MAPHINLEFSLFFSERMKWLHYSLLCRCHSSSMVASPSLVSILQTASALSCQRTAKLYWCLSSALMLIYSEWLRCYGIVWKHHSFPPHPLCFSSWLPNIFLHLQKQMKPNVVCRVLGAKFISNVDGAHSGIMSWLPKQSNPGRRGSGNWSGAALSIIIITLKDLHWWREGSQEGLWVMAVQIAPSVDHHGKHKDPVHCNAYEQERLLTMALKVLLLRVHKPVYALASYRRW